jgi:hypothetical protein
MRTSLVAFLVAILACGPVAFAQPASAPSSQSTLLELPKGKTFQKGSESLRGYTLEEFKVVLKIHTDYKSWGKQVFKYKKLVNDLTELGQTYSKQLILRAKQLATANKDRVRLTEKWREENRLRHLAENRPMIGSWVAWAAAAGFAALSAVLAGVLIAKD